ncbi:uncharacterized protein BDR25DRAFT_351865 [Lindgomyces ingoldianus]|uniref:Uncharacterized protein n=1 Tax=Lindgomyces ingoldianus TaxID=673940 RepID=A0ACB6R4V9_9PLEO|nr:uncharacterized protein BDR25DRAFT_351865 [Lindgomyces ingoldianus]KAF2474313.1 hypothetical protein BDR25DRAFT_351865 [Lindgomyces ingoldianus]
MIGSRATFALLFRDYASLGGRKRHCRMEAWINLENKPRHMLCLVATEVMGPLFPLEVIRPDLAGYAKTLGRSRMLTEPTTENSMSSSELSGILKLHYSSIIKSSGYEMFHDPTTFGLIVTNISSRRSSTLASAYEVDMHLPCLSFLLERLHSDLHAHLISCIHGDFLPQFVGLSLLWNSLLLEYFLFIVLISQHFSNSIIFCIPYFLTKRETSYSARLHWLFMSIQAILQNIGLRDEPLEKALVLPEPLNYISHLLPLRKYDPQHI